MRNRVIYLDNNSTTRIDAGVLEAMLPYLGEEYGNPASAHVLGRAARDAVERARQAVAGLIGGLAGRIVFTASATEANNLAITGLAGASGRRADLVTSTIEHKSVLEPVKSLERRGEIRAIWLRPDRFGQVQADALQEALTPDCRLVSILAASNVIHTLNPIADLARVCADRGVLFHCDATQWAGRLPLDVERLGIDALSLSAHKMYGPKWAAALWLGPRAMAAGVAPQIVGGGQEQGLRSGTLNVPAIVGFGAACQLSAQRLADDAARTRRLAARLWEGLRRQLDGLELNGHPSERLPGGLNVTLAGVDSRGLIAAVSEVAFSDGAACETQADAGYVLEAIGRAAATHQTVRFQVGRTTTEEEIDRAVELLVAGARRMRDFVL